MILQALSIAIALGYTVSIPEITWIKTFEEVRPVLDEYWADNGVLPVGLAINFGDKCFIYAVDLGDERSKEILLHETMHCWGLDHAQIDAVNNRLNERN